MVKEVNSAEIQVNCPFHPFNEWIWAFLLQSTVIYDSWTNVMRKLKQINKAHFAFPIERSSERFWFCLQNARGRRNIWIKWQLRTVTELNNCKQMQTWKKRSAHGSVAGYWVGTSAIYYLFQYLFTWLVNSALISHFRYALLTICKVPRRHCASRNYYDILQVNRKCSHEEIRDAFTKLSKQVNDS